MSKEKTFTKNEVVSLILRSHLDEKENTKTFNIREWLEKNILIEMYKFRIGKNIQKTYIEGQYEPFRNGTYQNIVKDIIFSDIPMYTFNDGDECVECRRCTLIEDIPKRGTIDKIFDYMKLTHVGKIKNKVEGNNNKTNINSNNNININSNNTTIVKEE